MDARKKENLRLSILRVLEANHTRFGLGVDAITLHVSSFGFPQITGKEVEPEIEYLEEKSLLEQALKVISRENRAWRISNQGRAFLDERLGGTQ